MYVHGWGDRTRQHQDATEGGTTQRMERNHRKQMQRGARTQKERRQKIRLNERKMRSGHNYEGEEQMTTKPANNDNAHVRDEMKDG